MDDTTHTNVDATDGRHDFDFYVGRWQVRNERLRQRLAGSSDWEVFAATQECRPILDRPGLDGLGNLDDFVTDWGRPGTDEKFLGMTVRLFNPQTRQWSLYWAGNHDGVLEPPVVGSFENGVGTFIGQAEHNGRPVLARFTWDQISANAAHWQQAFSTDAGQSWETNWHMWMRRLDADGRLVHDDAVIELRQYAMHPGRRDTLVELFEREFIEPQEAVGIHVIGHFHDLDDPDRYVWMRGFPGMPARAASLASFYFGPVWQRHREAANATLLDNDDVLLLKPARLGSGFAAAAAMRAPVGSTAGAGGVFSVGICALDAPAERGFGDRFERVLAPLLRAAGAELLATYATEPSENTFPRLPVREGERVFVWCARFDDEAAHRRHVAALADDPRWREAIADALLAELKQPPRQLRLALGIAVNQTPAAGVRKCQPHLSPTSRRAIMPHAPRRPTVPADPCPAWPPLRHHRATLGRHARGFAAHGVPRRRRPAAFGRADRG